MAKGPQFEVGPTKDDDAQDDLDRLLGGGRPQAKKKSGAAERKMNAYVDPEIQAAAKRAQWWTQTSQDGYRTFSDMVEAALEIVTKQLEEAHNGGEPFAEIPDSDQGKLRAGRRLGT